MTTETGGLDFNPPWMKQHSKHNTSEEVSVIGPPGSGQTSPPSNNKFDVLNPPNLLNGKSGGHGREVNHHMFPKADADTVIQKFKPVMARMRYGKEDMLQLYRSIVDENDELEGLTAQLKENLKTLKSSTDCIQTPKKAANKDLLFMTTKTMPSL